MLNVRLTPTTVTSVKAEVVIEPTPARIATLLPVSDFGTCEECGSELTPLIGNDDKVRTVFCEHCDC